MVYVTPEPTDAAGWLDYLHWLANGVENDLTAERLEKARDSLADALAASERRVAELEEALADLRALVNEQAEDEALWALNLDGSLPISEAYLQQELRRLHGTIERVLSAVGQPERTER